MQQPDQERTEQATPHKREEARNRGEVQRSADFNNFVVIAAALGTLLATGTSIWGKICATSQALFFASGSGDLRLPLEACAQQLLGVVLPVGLAALVLVILGGLLQTGPIFSFVPIEPRFERINPVNGFRRLFSGRAFFELLKSLIKLGVLTSIAYFFVLNSWTSLLSLGQQTPAGELEYLAGRAGNLVLRLTAALLVVGLIDWAYVRWQYGRQLMMSRRDLREEVRRREGDPQIRARIRELQRENRKQSRSLGRMPDADVLITNPDHVGVALRYVRSEMKAPLVIAKGTGLWLDRMKELARRHSVPVRQQPALARRLFRHGAVEHPIPPETYVEVAHLYADLAAAKRSPLARYEVGT